MEEKFMRRAIALARRGIGKVNPNPLVGAVIVKDGEIIAEGWHAKYGELHAERHAFSNLKGDCTGAEMYVTLEPCCHYGKQPPCTQAIIEHGIAKVYVGSDDPNELVRGKGIRQLEEAGVEVETQVLKEECDKLNPVFFHYITTHTPYVLMKYAMTADGKIACDTGESRWVTNQMSRAHVQETRNEFAAIMAGVQTVIADNPRLTCRMEGGRNPIRIICDSNLRIPLSSNVVQTARQIRTIVATVSTDGQKREALTKQGVELITTPPKDGRVNLKELMLSLGKAGIDSILLEGGSTLNESAIREQIVNAVQVYMSPKIFGGSGRYTPVRGEGVKTPEEAVFLENPSIEWFGEDILLQYDVRRS